MSDYEKKHLSREDIAKFEIGRTTVSAAQKWSLTLFFLLFIAIYPILQTVYRQPFAEWRSAGTVQQSIQAYETAMEESSLLRKYLLSPVQHFLTGKLKFGNEKAILGRDGWLFFSGDCEYLLNPGFLLPERLNKRRMSGVQPDPAAAVLDFNRQLAARGIRLILLPVPVKPMLYSDKLGGSAAPLQNPSWTNFKAQMTEAGITVIDPTAEFSAMRTAGEEPYLKTDTHWTPSAMTLTAKMLALNISGTACNLPEMTPEPHTASGDIAAMLKLPDSTCYFPAETVNLLPMDGAFSRDSEILLLGDSFTNIYSLAAMNWGAGSGFAEHLAHYLGRPVDVIARNDAGAFATRQLLAHELKRGRDRLAGKTVVVWEFAIRELVNGDWKILDMTLGNPPESELLEIAEPRIATATVLAVSAVPRPNSAPYKDFVMSIYLGDIDGGVDRILAYAAGMRDNVRTEESQLRPGDHVLVKLTPWSEVDALYGAWSRGEFDDEELLLASPCWLELQKP